MEDGQQGISRVPERVPERVAGLLERVGAQPRLVAHLELVHGVAVELLAAVGRRWPGVEVDEAAVRFGAATHDVGKVRHPEELTGPGHAHEPAGYALLVELGVDPADARFARTHASWGLPGISLEELLVALADKVWKNRREEELEDLVTGRIAEICGLERWEVFLELDEVLTAIGEGAEGRLAYQSSFPVVG